MAHGDAREGKWRGNWRMKWVASTLHTTSEHSVSSITTSDAHTSAACIRLNWIPRRFKWNLVSARAPSHFNWPLPFRRFSPPFQDNYLSIRFYYIYIYIYIYIYWFSPFICLFILSVLFQSLSHKIDQNGVCCVYVCVYTRALAKILYLFLNNFGGGGEGDFVRKLRHHRPHQRHTLLFPPQ